MSRADVLIEVTELQAQLSNPEWRIVDCRFDLLRPGKGFADYSAAHIPGAVYANLDRDLAGAVTPTTGRHPLPTPSIFSETLGRWGITSRSTVIVYDDANGAIASRLWWMLAWVGFPSVRLLNGGFAAWNRDKLPVDSCRSKVDSTRFFGVAEDRRVISTREIEQVMASDPSYPLIDARDPTRFAGVSEPIDRVAGHIPGARNFPFTNSLRDDGRFLSAYQLREAWSSVLGQDESRIVQGGEWAVMCGSGVTACHLAVSAQLAGLAPPRLYAGSWSEWISDPERPVVSTGGAR